MTIKGFDAAERSFEARRLRDAEAMFDDADEHLDHATESELAAILDDEGSVEEAIGQNSDVVRVKLAELTAHPERAVEIAAFLNSMIRSYLEPQARMSAERAL